MLRSCYRSILAGAVVIATLFTTSAAQAEYLPKAWAGGLLGLTVPSADGTTARGMYGLTAGAKLGTEWGVGVYYLSSQKNENSFNFNFDFYGVQFGYHFEGEANGVFVAGRIGTSKVGSNNSSPMNIGAVVGYDYMLIDHVSLGGEASFLSIGSSSGSANAGFTALNFLGALKFWF